MHNSDAYLDDWRLARAGKSIRKCMLLWVKADWAEVNTTLGFPQWGDQQRPCPWCNSSKDDIQEICHMTPDTFKWRLNRPEDYCRACDRCEFCIVVNNPEEHSQILGLLKYDKRREGGRGRVLTGNIDAKGLRVQDRLTEEAGLGDIDAVDHLTSYPFNLIFWRRINETMSRNRNPLFCRPDIGLDPVTLLVIDQLHSMNLGILLVWCKYVLWQQLEAGLWVAQASLTEQVEASIGIIKVGTKRTSLPSSQGLESFLLKLLVQRTIEFCERRELRHGVSLCTRRIA